MAAESIYGWIAEAEPEVVKAPMYRSKHNPDAPIVGSTYNTGPRRGHGTMGSADNRPNPKTRISENSHKPQPP